MDIGGLLTCKKSSASPRVEAKDAFVGMVGAVTLLGPPQYRAEYKASNEASNVGPPRNAGGGCRREELRGSLQNLN
jgi:hypothetical protein